jgi:ureidoacrylate peracid hydrolase
MHKTEIHPDAVARIMARRGKMHVHETIDAKRTALVVIDMQVAFLEPGAPSEVPMAREIVPAINRLADALRAAGGTVAWVYNTFTEKSYKEWSSFFGATYAGPFGRKVAENLFEGAPGHKLWPQMKTAPGDLWVEKNRFSAFLPGASDIEGRLRERGIDTVLITGTLTNNCCEASARDAMMRNFNVIMVSDGNATYTDAIHNASLTSMAITFADIMTTDEVIARLVPAANAAPQRPGTLAAE